MIVLSGQPAVRPYRNSNMSGTCQDDLTLTDLLASSLVSSRLTAGSAATTNLFGQIDRDKVWGLNIDTPSSAAASSSRTGLEGEGRGRGKGEAKEVIKEWAERGDESVWVESQEDPDLILTVPFVQNVRVRSLLLKTAAGEEAPAVVRLWANRADGITFSEAQADGIKPSQEISLDPSVMQTAHGNGVIEYPLKVQVFKDVVSLSLYFGDAPGEEKSRIYYLGFLGDPRNPKKENDTEMTIPAATAPDLPVKPLQESSAPHAGLGH